MVIPTEYLQSFGLHARKSHCLGQGLYIWMREKVPSRPDLYYLRRLRFDLLCCCKIIFGLVRIDRKVFFELRTSCTRGHPYKLFKHHSKITVTSNFFVEKVINAWNGLLADRIDFSSYPRFHSSPQHCVLTAS